MGQEMGVGVRFWRLEELTASIKYNHTTINITVVLLSGVYPYHTTRTVHNCLYNMYNNNDNNKLSRGDQNGQEVYMFTSQTRDRT